MIVETLWERALHQSGAHSAVAAGEGLVVVHERRTRLVGLDAGDGAPRWDVPGGTWPRAVVVADGRCLVLPQAPDTLDCRDLADGTVVWSARLPRHTGHLVVADGVVLVGGWRGYTPLAAFDLGDGRPLWRGTEPVRTGHPLVWGGGVLCGSGLDVWLVDPRTGAELARWRLPGAAAHGAVADAELQPVFTALDPDRCVVRCGPRALVLLRRSAGTAGSWFSHDADLAARAPELCGAVLWLRERRAGWVAVDPADGRRLWTVAGGPASAWGVAEVGGGFVVVDEGGSLLRLDADGRVLGRQPVGRRISALHGLGGGRVAVSGKGTLKGLALGWATGAAGLSTRVDTSGSST